MHIMPIFIMSPYQMELTITLLKTLSDFIHRIILLFVLSCLIPLFSLLCLLSPVLPSLLLKRKKSQFCIWKKLDFKCWKTLKCPDPSSGLKKIVFFPRFEVTDGNLEDARLEWGCSETFFRPKTEAEVESRRSEDAGIHFNKKLKGKYLSSN